MNISFSLELQGGEDHTHQRDGLDVADHTHQRDSVPLDVADHTHQRDSVPLDVADHTHLRDCVANTHGNDFDQDESEGFSNRIPPDEAAKREMEALFQLPVGVARDQVMMEVGRLEEERRRHTRDEAMVESHMYQDARVRGGGVIEGGRGGGLIGAEEGKVIGG